MKLRSLALLLMLAACGGEDENLPADAPVAIDAAVTIDAPVVDSPVTDGTPTIDAPATIDAASSVQLIADCQGIGNPDVTVSAATGQYVPANPTLQVNDVLRFEPGSPTHDMQETGGAFQTPLGQVTCLRFTAPGTFPVRCSIHQFTTTITVN